MAYIDDDIGAWTAAAANLHMQAVSDELARDAGHAAAMLMSGSGFLNAPMEILQMFAELLEAGYAQALRDVGDGKYDIDIAEWRPDLTGS